MYEAGWFTTFLFTNNAILIVSYRVGRKERVWDATSTPARSTGSASGTLRARPRRTSSTWLRTRPLSASTEMATLLFGSAARSSSATFRAVRGSRSSPTRIPATRRSGSRMAGMAGVNQTPAIKKGAHNGNQPSGYRRQPDVGQQAD